MRKYALIAALILLIVVLYTFREQNLGDVLEMDQVERILLDTGERDLNEVNIEIVDQDKIDKLADFLNQYQLRRLMEKGWVSDYPSEQFTLFLVYKNGEMEMCTIERDVVSSTVGGYKIVNSPLDYKWIQEFESVLNSE